jgi:hypothetical protein
LPQLPFMQGANDRGWIADADFFLRPDAVLKISEGKYRDKAPRAQQPELAGYTLVDPMAQ